MRHFAAGLPVAILFIANVFPSLAQSGGGAEEVVEVVEGAPLRLRCELRPEQRLQWRRDGGPLPGDVRAAAEAPAGRALAAELRAPAAAPRHAGRYTCAAGGRATRLVVLPAPAPAPAEAALAAAGAGGAEAAGGAGGAGEEVWYDVRANLSLSCGLRASAGQPYVWTKNGTLLEEVQGLKDRIKFDDGGRVFIVSGRSVEEDYGNYSCRVGDDQVQQFSVRGKVHAKLPANTNVVEGQKLKLVCRLIGKPYSGVTWTFSNEQFANGSDVRNVFGERVELRASEQGVADAELLLAAARRDDAGVYTCVPTAASAVPAATTLRVKDMYAALWPFLGIVAEVACLCAVILVYERRRAKPELDDSDADTDAKKS